MEDWVTYVGGALTAAVVALLITLLGFGMGLREALGPVLIAMAVAVIVIYGTE
jgi:hypothetical protein